MAQTTNNTDAPPPLLLKGSAAAAYIGVGRTKFYELMVDEPLLQPVRLKGTHPLWRRDDLEKYVKSLKK